jgi:hypothetical protein
VSDIVLSDEEYQTLQEGIAAWLDRQRTDPDAIWRQAATGANVLYPEPVIDVLVVEEPVRSRWTVDDKFALFLTGVMVVVLGGAGIVLAYKYRSLWSLFGLLDVAILIGCVVWVYGDRMRRKGC